MVSVSCQGYCGGRVLLQDVRKTADGERFCPDCYETWRHEVK